jgi:hypothetical protein
MSYKLVNMTVNVGDEYNVCALALKELIRIYRNVVKYDSNRG